jgi:hypothetical protein
LEVSLSLSLSLFSLSFFFFFSSTFFLAQVQTWFGGIFNVGPDGMTSGDCWMLYFVGGTVNTAADYFSSSRNMPSLDNTQDLTSMTVRGQAT